MGFTLTPPTELLSSLLLLDVAENLLEICESSVCGHMLCVRNKKLRYWHLSWNCTNNSYLLVEERIAHRE